MADQAPGAEVATRPVVPDHHTGEVIDLAEADTTTLAAWVAEARQITGAIRDAQGLVGDELLRRMDRAASWTLRTEGWEVTGDSPDVTEYEIGQLQVELARLVDENVIDQAAADACIRTPEPKPEVAKRGVTALLKALKGNPEATARIEACTVPARRKVKKVERVETVVGEVVDP